MMGCHDEDSAGSDPGKNERRKDSRPPAGRQSDERTAPASRNQDAGNEDAPAAAGSCTRAPALAYGGGGWHPPGCDYECFFDLSQDLLCIADPHGNLRRINAAWERKLGYTRGELLALPPLSLVHPDDVKYAQGALESLREGGTIDGLTVRCRSRNGSYLWLSWNVQPVLEEGVLYAVARDVTADKERSLALEIQRDELERDFKQRTADLLRTNRRLLHEVEERRRIARALKRSRRLLSESQKLAHVGSYSRDLATDALTWSAEQYRNFGYAPGEVQPTRELVDRHLHPEDSDRFHATIERLFQGEAIVDFEYRIIRRDGEVRTLRTRSTLEYDTQGKAVRKYGATQDVTDLKRTEELLRRDAILLANAEQAANQGAWEFDFVNDRITLSKNWCRIHGFDKQEAPFDDVGGIAHPDDLPRIQKSFEAAKRSGRRYHIQHRIIRPNDGEVRHIHALGDVVRGPGGQCIKMYGVAQDVTAQVEGEEERRKLQRHLLQAQKMEAIGTLAGGIAHDFNNILEIIIGYTELVVEELGESSPAGKKLQHVLKAGSRGRNLTRQILTFGRDTEPSFEVFDLVPVVNEVRDLLRATLPAMVTLSCDVAIPEAIMRGDPAQMHQVLLNLGTNAAQAMQESGGELCFTLRQTDCVPESAAAGMSESCKEGCYELICRDTGKGMDERTLARVFDPFFTTKAPDEGTGLGLSVVLGIVNAHGGVIDVRSSTGNGTTFEILLPRHVEAASEESDQAA
ncbi:MAG: PAS domain-containing protein [Candidatus Eisenbacteria bacterium]|nr:PAS domain-containing protein [Candidatus Eisenbacteria bacterium]